jgi:hypothetical protein
MANAIKQGSSIVVKNSLFALLGLILLSRPLAATAQQFGDFTYSSDGSAIALTGYSGPGGAVVIPATINGLPFTLDRLKQNPKARP